MTNFELLEILSKPWADIHDISKLAYCGRDKATSIRIAITNDLEKQNKKLPNTKTKYVPMRNVIEYLNLDIDYIYQMANKEKLLKLAK